MRCVTYAGETVITTDAVAASLVELTASLARRGLAEAVSIPVWSEDSHDRGDAELVVGVGNDVLSVGTTWPDSDPDTRDETAELRRRIEGASHPRTAGATHYDRVLDDYEFTAHDDAAETDAAPEPAPATTRAHLRSLSQPRDR